MPPIQPVTPGEPGGWQHARPAPHNAPTLGKRRSGPSEASLDEPLVLWHVLMDEWTPAWHHEGPWPHRVQIAMYRDSSAGEPTDEQPRVDYRA